MKKLITIFLTLFMLLSAAACQPTPEQAVVVKKDMERMVEKAGNADIGVKLSDMDVSEGRYTYSATGAGGKLRINVDASVSLPEADGIPILRVAESGFSQEMVTGIFNFLYPNRKPYNVVTHTITKAEVEEMLLRYKKMQADGSYDKDFYTEEQWQRKIDETEMWLKNVPETANDGVSYISDGTMTRFDDGKSVYYNLHCWMPETEDHLLLVRSYDTDGINRDLSVYDGADAMSLNSSLYYDRDMGDALYSIDKSIQTDGKEVPPSVEGNLTVGLAEAQKICDDFLTASGSGGVYRVGNVAYLPDKSGKYAIKFIYTRMIWNIPTTFIAYGDGFGMADSYSLPWGYEYVEVLVDAEGIAMINWRNPVETGEKLEPNVGMMTFDEVKPIFEKMMKTIWEPRVDWGGTAADPQEIDIFVDRVALELCRVREQNAFARRQGIFVPAWVFYGHSTRTTTMSSQEYYTYDEVGGVGQSSLGAPIPILVINAVDGSIIDLARGY